MTDARLAVIRERHAKLLRGSWEGQSEFEAEAAGDVGYLLARIETLERALTGLLELGRKDTSNPKYDGYYDTARAALQPSEAAK